MSIEGVVASNYVLDGGTIKITVSPYHEIFVKKVDLTMVRPAFEVDDQVTWSTHDGADSWTGRVLSISNDHLWVNLDDGSFSTVWVGHTMRVDPAPEPAVEPAPVEEAA
ncbi:hypothetical protein [Mesorhizobium sp. 2RAF21]|uniref:hypothetical protein n=1 Tax=Mesorhizobium sp. 2RAF21 TaxID=3232995 RepID=UPI003F98B53D